MVVKKHRIDVPLKAVKSLFTHLAVLSCSNLYETDIFIRFNNVGTLFFH